MPSYDLDLNVQSSGHCHARARTDDDTCNTIVIEWSATKGRSLNPQGDLVNGKGGSFDSDLSDTSDTCVVTVEATFRAGTTLLDKKEKSETFNPP